MGPATRLPTVRALAVDLDISYNTVNRAYMDLEREGYITTRKGRGTFVAERREVGAARAVDSPVEPWWTTSSIPAPTRAWTTAISPFRQDSLAASRSRRVGRRPVPRRSGCSRIADGSIFCCNRLRHLNNRSSIIYVDGYGCGDERALR